MMEILLNPLVLIATAMGMFYLFLWLLDKVIEVHDDEG